MPDAQSCPICGQDVPSNPRYPRYVCRDCVDRAADVDGRRLRFHNTSLSGGCAGVHMDDDTPYEGQDCWIDGVACRANEARFGGIVIEPKEA